MQPRVLALSISLLGIAGLAYAASRSMRNGLAPAIDLAQGRVDLPQLGADLVDFGEVLVNRATEIPADVTQDQADSNVQAFLAALRASEGTDRAGDPYRVVFGFGYTLQDLSDHPWFTGEWKGAPFDNARQWSTAAGAYQFIRGTWADLRTRLELPDFGPASQDAAAVELIRQRGALEDVKAGRFADAVTKVRRVWASLPGAGYGQPERSLQQLASYYQANGGTLA